jgi:hypothetical protein
MLTKEGNKIFRSRLCDILRISYLALEKGLSLARRSLDAVVVVFK